MDFDILKSNKTVLENNLNDMKTNYIDGLYLPDFISKTMVNRLDPIQYAQNVLRTHLPDSRRYLHENQVALIRAVCNPRKINAAQYSNIL